MKRERRGPDWPGTARARIDATLALARPMVLVAGAIVVPVLYYLLLSHVDGGWATSELNSISTAVIPGLVTLTCLVPLAAIGILAARRLGPDPRMRAPLLWLLATLCTIAISPSGQYRASTGLPSRSRCSSSGPGPSGGIEGTAGWWPRSRWPAR